MTVRGLASIAICLLATVTVALAQPDKGAPAPAKDPAPPAGSAGSDAPAPVDEGPPADIEGREENPDAPRGVTVETTPDVTAAPAKKVRSGYPIEEALRPITLPANMAEVAIVPQLQVDADDVGFVGAAPMRARYGITRQVQLALTYVLGGVYDDPRTTDDKVGFHPGKALGLDVTYLARDFVGVKVGVPVWIYRPEEGGAPAIGLTLGVPLKFTFGEKFALGGLDDLLSIKLTRFAPSLEHEYLNAGRAAADDINTAVSAGFLRFSAYGIYQRSPKLALIGRVAVTLEDFTATGTQSNANGGLITTIKAGLQYTVRPFLDLGISIGFEDLSDVGSFAPTGLLAFRI